MKKTLLFKLGLLFIFMLPGCFHISDDEIIGKAHHVQEILASRYHELLKAPDEEAIVEFGVRMGAESRLDSWSMAGWWNNVLGNDYLTRVDGAPLSRTVYFLDNDIREINRQLGYLESRMFVSLPVYEKLRNMRSNLQYALQSMKSSGTYIDESRYIESRKLKLQELNEARRQNQILEDMSRCPTVVYEEKVITKTCPKAECKPVIVKEIVVEEKCDGKQKKKKKSKEEEETIINVDDIPGKRPHLVI